MPLVGLVEVDLIKFHHKVKRDEKSSVKKSYDEIKKVVWKKWTILKGCEKLYRMRVTESAQPHWNILMQIYQNLKHISVKYCVNSDPIIFQD